MGRKNNSEVIKTSEIGWRERVLDCKEYIGNNKARELLWVAEY